MKAVSKVTDIALLDVGPVLVQHGSTEGVNFTKTDGAHSGSLKAKTESADP